MIEKEYKKLISERQFEELLLLFEYDEKICQINFYYDCKNISAKTENLTVRVRSCNGTLVLQIKNHIKNHDGIQVSREYEKRMGFVPYIIEKEQIDNLCDFSIPSDTYLSGYLVTERCIKKFDNFFIALDKNTYLGITDYELEIEFEKEPPCGMIEYLKKYGVDLETGLEIKNKYKRFRKRLLSGEGDKVNKV